MPVTVFPAIDDYLGIISMTATLPRNLNSPTLHRLANGLTIIAEQMPVEAVNLNVWLKVGSALESDEINGMAHFLEHMVFKGTRRLASGEFERAIESRGAITNAATSQEYTHYYITTAPKDFAQLAPLQLEVVLAPLIADEAFDRERYVILEEIRRSNDNPRRRTYYRMMETCFETLPYRRPVLGPTSVIEHLTPGQMRDFHGTWYRPEWMTAVVVGNLPADELITTVAESLESIPTSPNPGIDAHPLTELMPETPFRDIVRMEYEDEQLQQARLIMFWKVPGLRDLEKTYALDVLAVILGQGKVSRLFQSLREERGLVSQISASNSSQGVQGMFSVSAQLPIENLALVEREILTHLRSIQENAIATSELARVCTQVANRFIFGNERPGDRANLYGYYHSQIGALRPAFDYPEIIQSLTIDDIQAAARQYLDTEAYGIVVAKPTPGTL
jgi:predicted Zn-dependent peptidase